MATNGIDSNDCLVEAKDLFAKLSSLREESYRQFTDLMNCHSSNIRDGIRDLTEKVYSLQSELSVMRKEKSALLETVDDLNREIRQLHIKSQCLTQPDEEVNFEIVNKDIPNEDEKELSEI